MVSISKAAGHFFYHLNLAVQSFGDGVGNPVFEIGRNIGRMRFNGFGGFDNRCQARMSRPEIPT